MEVWKFIFACLVCCISIVLGIGLIRLEKIMVLNMDKKISDLELEVSKLIKIIKIMLYILVFLVCAFSIHQILFEVKKLDIRRTTFGVFFIILMLVIAGSLARLQKSLKLNSDKKLFEIAAQKMKLLYQIIMVGAFILALYGFLGVLLRKY